jgi:dienelactone hydrolase
VVRWLASEHGLDRIVLMATCFGARTALATAPAIPGLEAVALFPVPVRDLELGERFSSYPLTWYLRRLFRARTFKRLLNARFRKAYRKLFKSKVRRVGQGLRSPGDEVGARAPEVSSLFLKHLKAVLGRRIPVYLLYGDADSDYEDFERARSGELGDIIREAGPQLKLEVIRGHVHGLTNIENQDRVIELLTSWVTLEGSAEKLNRASS